MICLFVFLETVVMMLDVAAEWSEFYSEEIGGYGSSPS